MIKFGDLMALLRGGSGRDDERVQWVPVRGALEEGCAAFIANKVIFLSWFCECDSWRGGKAGVFWWDLAQMTQWSKDPQTCHTQSLPLYPSQSDLKHRAPSTQPLAHGSRLRHFTS